MAVYFDLKIYRTTNPDGSLINPKPKWWQRGPLKPAQEELPMLYLYTGDVRTVLNVTLDQGFFVSESEMLRGFKFAPVLQGVNHDNR